MDELLAKPNEESWSLGQVYMPLTNKTDYYTEQLESSLNDNQNSSEKMNVTAEDMFSKNEFPDEQIKNDPLISAKIQQLIDKLHLEREFKELRVRMNAAWDRITVTSSGKSKHPGLGYFTAQEWVQFADMYLRHHLHQKERIDIFLKRNFATKNGNAEAKN
jgi:hypothetical protein